MVLMHGLKFGVVRSALKAMIAANTLASLTFPKLEQQGLHRLAPHKDDKNTKDDSGHIGNQSQVCDIHGGSTMRMTLPGIQRDLAVRPSAKLKTNKNASKSNTIIITWTIIGWLGMNSHKNQDDQRGNKRSNPGA
ncbi:hypothetical protein HG530_008842 [Fusarium avenaceum]|nr:hypothetical protein HG530_008842 [Fusarium avenaceum]